MLKKEKYKIRGCSCYCPDCGVPSSNMKLSKSFYKFKNYLLVLPILYFTKYERKLRVRSRLRVIIFAVMIALTYRKFIKKIVKKIRRVSKVNHLL